MLIEYSTVIELDLKAIRKMQKNEYYLNEYYWLQGEIGITKAQNEKHKPSLVIKHIHQIIFFFVFWGWGVWGWGESYQLNSKWF